MAVTFKSTPGIARSPEDRLKVSSPISSAAHVADFGLHVAKVFCTASDGQTERPFPKVLHKMAEPFERSAVGGAAMGRGGRASRVDGLPGNIIFINVSNASRRERIAETEQQELSASAEGFGMAFGLVLVFFSIAAGVLIEVAFR